MNLAPARAGNELIQPDATPKPGTAEPRRAHCQDPPSGESGNAAGSRPVMQLEHKPSKVLIVGCSGSGKTQYWTRYLLGSRARLKFVFDHEGEFAGRLKFRPATTLEQLATAAGRGWCVFDPARLYPGATPEAFAFFLDFAFTLSTQTGGRKLFACDELQAVTDTHTVSPELACVLETGRRYGLDFAAIAQQPNLVHNRVRNQATEVVTFQQMDPRAVDWCAAVGFDPAAVRGLAPGQYLARNLKTGGPAAGRVF